MKKITQISLLFFTLISIYSFSQTNVSGPSFSDVTWDELGSPYNVTGDFQIPSGVTLTIAKNVVVNFNSSHKILIKGIINIQGTDSEPVTFNGNNSGTAMLMFKSTNLSNSSISYVIFNGQKNALQLAEESEHNQDSVKNSGTLNLNNITLNNSLIATKGYDSGAKLKISDSEIKNSTIVGYYPRTEEIELINCNINTNSEIKSDAYNYGIKITNGTIDDSILKIGCCGANIDINNTTVNNSSLSEGDGSPVNGPINIKNCTVSEFNINLNSSKVNFENSNITNFNSSIIIGNGEIKNSKFNGNDSNNGLTISGYNGYNVSGNSKIISSEISGFNTGLKINNTNSLEITDSNIYNNSTWNIQNLSNKNISANNNYWGETNTTAIRNKIYDYYKDIELGEIQFTSFSTSSFNTSTLSNNKVNKINYFSTYPNPVIDILNINGIKNNESTSFLIISTNGKIIRSGNITTSFIKLNLSNLTPGVYIIILKNSNNSEFHKIIKL